MFRTTTIRNSIQTKRVNCFNKSIIRSFSNQIERDKLEFDVLIIGGGPAGLSAAIRLKQLCQ